MKKGAIVIIFHIKGQMSDCPSFGSMNCQTDADTITIESYSPGVSIYSRVTYFGGQHGRIIRSCI